MLYSHITISLQSLQAAKEKLLHSGLLIAFEFIHRRDQKHTQELPKPPEHPPPPPPPSNNSTSNAVKQDSVRLYSPLEPPKESEKQASSMTRRILTVLAVLLSLVLLFIAFVSSTTDEITFPWSIVLHFCCYCWPICT